VRPPDINLSQADFSVVYDPGEPHDATHGHIRFGLNAIKGTGGAAIHAIVEEREANGPYESLYDFCERLPSSIVNKATIEALVTCGAFDSVHGIEKRAAMVAAIEGAVSAAAEVHADKSAGQMNFFGAFEEAAPVEQVERASTLPSVPAWPQKEMLDKEKEVLGFYVSAHPLDQHRGTIEAFANADTKKIADLAHDSVVLIGGQITRVRPVMTRKGDKMAIITFDDLQGQIDCVLFPRTFARCAPHLTVDAIVMIEGQVDLSRGDPQLIVEDVFPIEEAERRLATRIDVTIRLDEHTYSSDTLHMLAGAMRTVDDRLTSDVTAPLRLHIVTSDRTVTLAADDYKLPATPMLRRYVTETFGSDCYRVTGGRRIRQAARKRFAHNGNGNGNGRG
jgi:DNA polymerase-3 subunit alpha